MKHSHHRFAVALALAGALAMGAPQFAAAANVGGFSPPPTATPPERSSPGDSAGKKTEGATTRPSPAAPPTLPLAGQTQPQPLTGPIQLLPSKVKKLSKWEPSPAKWEDVTAVCPHCLPNWSVATNDYAYAKSDLNQALQTCSTKNYSVQDQQAAGCKGNDTMDQCTEKLYDHCMSLNFKKTKFAKTSEEELAAVRKLIQKAQAYVNYVEWRLNTYGK